MIISEISKIIRAAVEAEFPGDTTPCVLTPIADLSLGHLGTDILKRLANARRESPDYLAKRILPKMESIPHGSIRELDGFLNVTLSDTALLKPITSQFIEPARNIIIAPPKSGLDRVGYARIVAAATFNWSIASEHSNLVSHLGVLPASSGSSVAFPWIYQELFQPFNNSEVEDLTLERIISLSSGTSVIVWMYPDFLGRDRFKNFLTALRNKGDTEVTPRYLDRDLLNRIPDRLESMVQKLQAPEPLASLIIYLSRPEAGGEIDLGIPFNQERANISWSLLALTQLLKRWSAKLERQGSSTAGDTELVLSPIQRHCLARARLLPLMRTHAALNGDIHTLLIALEEMILTCSEYLNKPSVRIELEQGSPSAVTAAIISGALQSSSDIIASCLLFRDLVQVQPLNRPQL